MTNEHTSLEKYTSHFIRKGCERVMCERWVGDWTNCNILTPSSFVFSSTSFSFCWAAQSGVLRAHSPLLGAGSLYSILSPTHWHQLTRTVCRTGLRPPASCERRICTQFNPSTVKAISWCLRLDAPVSRLTDRPKVNMLHRVGLGVMVMKRYSAIPHVFVSGKTIAIKYSTFNCLKWLWRHFYGIVNRRS